MGGVDYQYDGEGRRVQQTVSSTVTKYLLDIQPGLSVVLSETTGSSVVRNVHAPKGIHARKDATNNWHWLMQDGLGSVRAEVSNGIAVEGSQNFAPYGSPVDALGSFGTYGFTGEPTDVNGLLYNRARYYVPSIGVFGSLDPFEGSSSDAISLNGYGYANANPINLTDPSGFSPEEDFWAGFLHGVADALPWEMADPGHFDRITRPFGCAGGGAVLNSIDGRFASGCDPRDFAKQVMDSCSKPAMTPQQERHQAFLNAVTPIFQSIAGASHWARVSLGYEQLPQGVSRLQAASEAVFGVINVFSGSAVDDLRSGDTYRVIGGLLKLVGFTEAIGAGYKAYKSLFPESTFKPISGTTFSGGTSNGNSSWRAYGINEYYQGTQVPKSFYLEVNGETYWVHPNATEHMAEYVIGHMKAYQSPYLGNFPLTSLADAVLETQKIPLKPGKNWFEFTELGQWQIGIDTAGNETYSGNIIYHARYQS